MTQELQLSPGTLTDADICEWSEKGLLISGDFKIENVKQACYEIRASRIFWETAATKENKRVEIEADGYFLLPPNSFVTAISLEDFTIPSNVIGRVMTKGQLFSIGIQPVNTYADPGFTGRLGITLYNASKRYLKITPGQSIAKMEFSVLPKAVTHPYVGQHGYQTEIWPIPVHLYASPADLEAASIDAVSTEEVERIYGPALGRMAKRLEFYEERLPIHLLAVLLTFIVLVCINGQTSLVVAVIAGVVSNVLSGVALLALAQRSSKKTSNG
jgi:dCTP deaminase